jgi:hypothetical protein
MPPGRVAASLIWVRIRRPSSPGADRAGVSVRSILAACGRLCHGEGGIELVGLAGLLPPVPLLLLP